MGRCFARSQGVRLRIRHAYFHILRARRPVCRVGLRVGRCFARSQGVRLRIRHAHLPVLRARRPVRYARPPVCRVGLRVRVEGLRVGAEDGGGSGARGSIGIGRGGGDETGTAHDRLLVALGRRSALLPLTDDGRGGVARAGPFSTLGKGDYRGMGSFILFFSFLFCSGGAHIGKIARGVLLLGGLVFHFRGRALGVGRFVFHFRGFVLGSDRSGDKRARGVRFLGEGVFALGGRDCIWARRRHLLGGFGVPFGGCFLLGGGQGVVFRQAAHGTAVGFARRAHPPPPAEAHCLSSRSASRGAGLGGGMAYIIACAVRMPLPRLAAGVGHCFYNSLRCARACLGLRSGWGTMS